EKCEPEPIHCPECGLIRSRGPVCPGCGHEAKRKSRFVVQVDGSLREHTGDIYRPRPVRYYDDTEYLWRRTYYQAKNSTNRMTFKQAVGWFFQKHHYSPPRDLALMPTSSYDWYLPVADVPVSKLTGSRREAAEESE